MVAMSGGVDSSVAALLMTRHGYDTAGITLRLFANEDVGISREKTCCSLEDVEDARSVAYQLGIPFHVFNFSDAFKTQVMDRFAAAYQAGATPNPCIDCNRFIKFDKLIWRARQLDYDYVVTGHYAVIEYDSGSGRYLLKKGLDPSKDQSYVLYSLTQEQLSRTLFPLGHMKKSEVRELAEENGLVNARKHDSQDICFVPDGDYTKFLETYSGKPLQPGRFIDRDGKALGVCRDPVCYTIGQRKGLGLSFPEPMYVCAKNTGERTVTLGPEKELYSKTLTAADVNLIACAGIKQPLRVRAKVRYRQEAQWATAEQTDETHFRLDFDSPQRAIAAGQAVVLYDGDVVIGGGTIE